MDLIKAVESPGGDKTHKNAPEHAGLDGGNSHGRRRFNPAYFRKDAHGGEEDREPNRACQRRHAVIIGQPDGHADGEKQRQVGENRSAGLRHDLRDDPAAASEKFALPTPSKMPATGSTETGSIMHLPIFWRKEKAVEKEAIVLGSWDYTSGRRARTSAPVRQLRARCASSWQSA